MKYLSPCFIKSMVYDFFIFSLDNVLAYGYYISRFEK